MTQTPQVTYFSDDQPSLRGLDEVVGQFAGAGVSSITVSSPIVWLNLELGALKAAQPPLLALMDEVIRRQVAIVTPAADDIEGERQDRQLLILVVPQGEVSKHSVEVNLATEVVDGVVYPADASWLGAMADLLYDLTDAVAPLDVALVEVGEVTGLVGLGPGDRNVTWDTPDKDIYARVAAAVALMRKFPRWGVDGPVDMQLMVVHPGTTEWVKGWANRADLEFVEPAQTEFENRVREIVERSK